MGDILPDWNEDFILSLFDGCIYKPINVNIKLNARKGWKSSSGVRVGFAYLEFSSPEEALVVIDRYNGEPISGISSGVFNLKTNLWSDEPETSNFKKTYFKVKDMKNINPLEPPLYMQLEPLTMAQLRMPT